MHRSTTFAIWITAAVLLYTGGLEVDGLVLTSPPEKAGTYFNTPIYVWMTYRVPFEGKLVRFQDALRANSSSQTEGRAVFITKADAERFSSHQFEMDTPPLWTHLHITHVVFTNDITDVAGASDVLAESKNHTAYAKIMVAEIGSSDSLQLEAYLDQFGDNLTVRIDTNDTNAWADIRQGAGQIVFQLFFACLSAACASVAWAKLAILIRVHGVRPVTIAHVCLFIEGIANTYRVSYMALDPIFGGRVFTGPEAQFFITISFPAGIITTLLVSLYWHEILSEIKLGGNNFLGKLQVPFIIICCVIFALEVATSSIRASPVLGLTEVTYIGAVVYIVITLSMSVMFFVIGIRVLRRLREGSKIASTKQDPAKKTTRLLVASVPFHLLWLVGYVMVAVPAIFWTVPGFYLSWCIQWLGMLGGSLCQILSFRSPTVHPKGGSSRPTNGSSNASSQSASTEP